MMIVLVAWTLFSPMTPPPLPSPGQDAPLPLLLSPCLPRLFPLCPAQPMFLLLVSGGSYLASFGPPGEPPSDLCCPSISLPLTLNNSRVLSRSSSLFPLLSCPLVLEEGVAVCAN